MCGAGHFKCFLVSTWSCGKLIKYCKKFSINPRLNLAQRGPVKELRKITINPHSPLGISDFAA